MDWERTLGVIEHQQHIRQVRAVQPQADVQGFMAPRTLSLSHTAPYTHAFMSGNVAKRVTLVTIMEFSLVSNSQS